MATATRPRCARCTVTAPARAAGPPTGTGGRGLCLAPSVPSDPKCARQVQAGANTETRATRLPVPRVWAQALSPPQRPRALPPNAACVIVIVIVQAPTRSTGTTATPSTGASLAGPSSLATRGRGGAGCDPCRRAGLCAMCEYHTGDTRVRAKLCVCVFVLFEAQAVAQGPTPARPPRSPLPAPLASSSLVPRCLPAASLLLRGEPAPGAQSQSARIQF